MVDFDAIEKNFVGKFTPAELATSRAFFKEVDLDGNGTLDANEVLTAMKNATGLIFPMAPVTQFISEVDTDHDGCVSYIELLTALAEAKQGDRDGPIAEILRKRFGWRK
eukprot:TRINITY_DN1783_c0_g1_i4.p3 TRINITY_DN1783_c0_g1~~TRINITY_DN1783_c0_g1_i4.p3  ORF type:complete len:109 (+),score=30.39 TRINITY_DN1783_c0_g1_i4:111-437(+)